MPSPARTAVRAEIRRLELEAEVATFRPRRTRPAGGRRGGPVRDIPGARLRARGAHRAVIRRRPIREGQPPAPDTLARPCPGYPATVPERCLRPDLVPARAARTDRRPTLAGGMASAVRCSRRLVAGGPVGDRQDRSSASATSRRSAGPPPDPPLLGRLGPAVSGGLSGLILEDAGRLQLRLGQIAPPDDPTRPWRSPGGPGGLPLRAPPGRDDAPQRAGRDRARRVRQGGRRPPPTLNASRA